ncbi:hypothetical protein [Roseicitreum antarcticum]|uniref:Uncharacterized protein n=1 Tax=Roseicitreum antarcticum TaxID=564137 RepID=A0A1H3E598_9RHOB|nr:hypothetical protein [Roseicitreum antarcticum]SDX73866.1 hypothetical protein SAMN04488238_11815 [Roseicitreum antarcticum]
MALKQSNMAQLRETTPSGYVSGARMVGIATYTVAQAFTAASDKLELAVLPADARLVSAELIGVGVGAITATMGLMSGEVGASDNARTVGNQLLAAVSINDTAAKATTLACLNIAPSNVHRSIGVTLSGNVAAGSAKKITLVLEYVF